MLASLYMRKPKCWQDFEKLCKLLWGEVWDCADSIKQHGRQGQSQQGVDVYAYVEKYKGYCGIQCKGKDDYSHAQLTEEEINQEIEKAKEFTPPLKRLIFATTANKDAKIEGYIRCKDIENHEQGLFHVELFSWEDIVDLLERERTVYNWYLNNCQFKESTSVKVTFSSCEDTVTINPQYSRIKKKFVYKEPVPNIFGINEELLRVMESYTKSGGSSFHNMLYPPRRIDKRWCNLYLRLENTGNTVLHTPKVKVFFRPEDIEKIDDRFHYQQVTWGCDQHTAATINAEKDRKREVFQTYSNEIEYRPLDKTIVQKDERKFSLAIIPKEGVEEMPLFWEFLCEDYSQTGFLTIVVSPQYHEKEVVVEVNHKEEEKEEIFIEPFIVEQ